MPVINLTQADINVAVAEYVNKRFNGAQVEGATLKAKYTVKRVGDYPGVRAEVHIPAAGETAVAEAPKATPKAPVAEKAAEVPVAIQEAAVAAEPEPVAETPAEAPIAPAAEAEKGLFD